MEGRKKLSMLEMIENLLQKINENNTEESIELVKQLGENQCVEAVPILIALLGKTESWWLTNTIALALKDIGDERAVEPIIALIKDPKSKGRNGTLLYCLEDFDTSPYLDFILELIGEGDFEVRREAYSLLEGMIDKIPDDKKEICIKRIKEMLEDASDRLDGLKVTFNLFSDEYMPVKDNLDMAEDNDENRIVH